MFSGRRDPQWVVKPESFSIYERIQELFSNAVKLGETYEPERISSILGYKGFLLDGGKDWAWAILGNKTKKLQEVLLQSIPEGLISKDLMAKIVNATQKGDLLDRIKAAVPGLQKSGTKRWAPPAYSRETRAIWNIGRKRRNNNCYNYANDRITDTFAQPGRAGTGDKVEKPFTDFNVKAAAINDGLNDLTSKPEEDSELSTIPTAPNTHLVALAVYESK